MPNASLLPLFTVQHERAAQADKVRAKPPLAPPVQRALHSCRSDMPATWQPNHTRKFQRAHASPAALAGFSPSSHVY
ncbi:uncharacterized protein SCHCODRAFT_02621017, partial [Schizophyllum commune H4-8]